MSSSPIFKFCYKGGRDYVHSTDIVSKLLEYYEDQNITDLDVKFNSIVATNLTLIQWNNCQTAKVNISFDLDGITKQIQLLENDRIINCNYEYNEKK